MTKDETKRVNAKLCTALDYITTCVKRHTSDGPLLRRYSRRKLKQELKNFKDS